MLCPELDTLDTTVTGEKEKDYILDTFSLPM